MVLGQLITPEENCPWALILTLTLNKTLTLPGGQISSEVIVRIPSNICKKTNSKLFVSHKYI